MKNNLKVYLKIIVNSYYFIILNVRYAGVYCSKKNIYIIFLTIKYFLNNTFSGKYSLKNTIDVIIIPNKFMFT